MPNGEKPLKKNKASKISLVPLLGRALQNNDQSKRISHASMLPSPSVKTLDDCFRMHMQIYIEAVWLFGYAMVTVQMLTCTDKMLARPKQIPRSDIPFL